MKKILIIVTFSLMSCSTESDWEILFDGENVSGLRGYRQDSFPSDDWKVVDGTLKTMPGHGVDLISEKVYKNFELELEWKVAVGGNSGIFYYATEEGDYIWQTAPEMQVLDNDVHTDGKNTLTSAGALYAMIASSELVVKPAGEFNKVKIKAYNNNIEHWLNGVKIVEYTYGSKAMWDLVKKSKFNKMPLFAKASEGRIGLQGDHGEVWYRNIKIRKL